MVTTACGSACFFLVCVLCVLLLLYFSVCGRKVDSPVAYSFKCQAYWMFLVCLFKFEAVKISIGSCVLFLCVLKFYFSSTKMKTIFKLKYLTCCSFIDLVSDFLFWISNNIPWPWSLLNSLWKSNRWFIIHVQVGKIKV